MHPALAEALSVLASICEATGREFECEQLSKRGAAIVRPYALQVEAAAPKKRSNQPDSTHSAPVRPSLRSDLF